MYVYVIHRAYLETYWCWVVSCSVWYGDSYGGRRINAIHYSHYVREGMPWAIYTMIRVLSDYWSVFSMYGDRRFALTSLIIYRTNFIEKHYIYRFSFCTREYDCTDVMRTTPLSPMPIDRFIYWYEGGRVSMLYRTRSCTSTQRVAILVDAWLPSTLLLSCKVGQLYYKGDWWSRYYWFALLA